MNTDKKPVVSSDKQKISFDVPAKLLAQMDAARKKSGQNRSNWICIAIMEKIAREREEK